MTFLLAFGVLGDTGSSGLRSHVEKIPLMLCFSNFRAIWVHLAHKYPPTPAASRGSAPEEALLASRGEKKKFAGPVLRALLFGCGGGAVLGQTASFLVSSESNVRQWGLWPAGPVRPSGPCCLAVAQAPFWVRQLVFL